MASPSPNSIPLCVKWNKLVLDFNFDPDAGVKGLKAELEERTHVPTDRMKLMAKSKNLWKGVLKDDVTIDWTAAYTKNKKEPLSIMLMGSAAMLEKPAEKVVFLEDLPPEKIAQIQEPSGLVNLGNTCYLNSVVQCLRVVAPLRNVLSSGGASGGGGGGGNGTILPKVLSDTLSQLDRQTTALPPHTLVHATKMTYPQFNQTGPHGQPQQQDAEEFYSNLLQTLAANSSSGNSAATQQQILQVLSSAQKSTGGSGTSSNIPVPAGINNAIDALFGLKLQDTLTCQETDQEPPVTSFDWHRKLVCNIQGGSQSSSVNVNHIYDGIQLALFEDQVEKHSSVLNRNALWKRQQYIARLPPFLTIQFGRFYWKATPNSQDHTGVKCKVMKPVAFSGALDLFDFCNDEIKAVLRKSRQAALAADEARVQAKLLGKENESKDADMTDADANDDSKMEEDAELQAALAMSLQQDQDAYAITESDLATLGPGLPTDFKGYYELFAVVTHKGRDADGGHYMAWVKADTGNGNKEKIADTDEENEDWYVFDDDEVSPCKTEDVLKLKGGGDWHMSYLNFYRAKR